jgi:hypothetical protein
MRRLRTMVCKVKAALSRDRQAREANPSFIVSVDPDAALLFEITTEQVGEADCGAIGPAYHPQSSFEPPSDPGDCLTVGEKTMPRRLLWYAEMLAATEPDGLIYSYADWEVPSDQLPYLFGAADVQVPLPPPGQGGKGADPHGDTLAIARPT